MPHGNGDMIGRESSASGPGNRKSPTLHTKSVSKVASLHLWALAWRLVCDTVPLSEERVPQCNYDICRTWVLGRDLTSLPVAPYQIPELIPNVLGRRPPFSLRKHPMVPSSTLSLRIRSPSQTTIEFATAPQNTFTTTAHVRDRAPSPTVTITTLLCLNYRSSAPLALSSQARALLQPILSLASAGASRLSWHYLLPASAVLLYASIAAGRYTEESLPPHRSRTGRANPVDVVDRPQQLQDHSYQSRRRLVNSWRVLWVRG